MSLCRIQYDPMPTNTDNEVAPIVVDRMVDEIWTNANAELEHMMEQPSELAYAMILREHLKRSEVLLKAVTLRPECKKKALGVLTHEEILAKIMVVHDRTRDEELKGLLEELMTTLHDEGTDEAISLLEYEPDLTYELKLHELRKQIERRHKTIGVNLRKLLKRRIRYRVMLGEYDAKKGEIILYYNNIHAYADKRGYDYKTCLYEVLTHELFHCIQKYACSEWFRHKTLEWEELSEAEADFFTLLMLARKFGKDSDEANRRYMMWKDNIRVTDWPSGKAYFIFQNCHHYRMATCLAEENMEEAFVHYLRVCLNGFMDAKRGHDMLFNYWE